MSWHMDRGLWPQSSASSPAEGEPLPHPATRVLSEQLCNDIAEKSLSIHPLTVSEHLPVDTTFFFFFCQLSPDLKTWNYSFCLFPEGKNKTTKSKGVYGHAVLSLLQRGLVRNTWITVLMTDAAEPKLSPIDVERHRAQLSHFLR